jgi:serine/threonine-protein kinase
MISRRQSPVVVTGEDVLVALRASGLLPPDRVEALASGHIPADPRAWVSNLVEHGLLTGYQAEQLLAGRAHSLLLGQYRILDALGAGGMGRVYKAEHVLMRRLVALKMVGSAEDAEPAFLREIEVAARLAHPNIVAAYDAGEANGVRFLVMEYVDGVDLERRVRAVGPLAPRRACEYVRQAAIALQYAFECGVLHRDVKPANLLVEPADDPRSPGRVKVLDLGLALSTEGSDCGAAAGHLSGTPDYIAPEVAHDPDGRDVRSDVYSLGCTLYYLLTGQVPFPGGTWTEKLLHHQYDAPAPLRDLAPAVPPALAAVVERLMAKALGGRYDSPGAAARALEEWLARGEDPPAAAAPAGDGEEPSTVRPAARPHGPERAEPRTAPVVAVAPGPASAWDIPAPPPAPAPRPASQPRRSRLWSWLGVVYLAVLTGLGGAWLLRGCLVAEQKAAATSTAPGFILQSGGIVYPTLAAAVAAAADGDTIVIQGDGPFATAPLTVTGKALTLRAAPDSHPVLQLGGTPAAWRALLATDRPLSLEGIELRPATDSVPTHLLYATGASLRLVRCRVTAPRQSAPVVVRRACRVELHDCHLVAGGLALCAETGPGLPCALVLSGNKFEVREAGAAAVSVWAEYGLASPVAIEMDGNEFRSGRVLSLRGLTGGASVTARNNHFDFAEGLLCLNDLGGPDGWRRAVTWYGQRNRCRGSGDWLHVDGRPAGVCGLQAWQQTWTTDTDSEPLP